MANGAYLEPSKLTLRQFLDRWLEHVEPRVSPRTFERYAEIVRKNIVPLLGYAVLMKLRPDQMSCAYIKALKSGRRDGAGGLSPRTVHHMHRVLKQALAVAVKWSLLPRNPTDSVDPPKVERTTMRALDTSETAAFLGAHSSYAKLYLGVTCRSLRSPSRRDCRPQWRAVDLPRGQIFVVESIEQTKTGTRMKETKNGCARTIALPFSSNTGVEAPSRPAIRRTASPRNEVNQRYLCRHPRGWKTAATEQSYTRICPTPREKPVLPRIRFHDLRHSHTTKLLASVVHPKVAQERLGDSNIGSHVAAAKVDVAIRAAIDRS